MFEDDIRAEIIKDNGELADTGRGQLVLSDLENDAMPLIRYKLGDIVEITEYKKKKYIKILGRSDDSILIDGEPFNKKNLVEEFKQIMNTPQFFILITKDNSNYQDKVLINISKKHSGKRNQIEKFIRDNLELSHIFGVNLYDKEMPKTLTGKYRHIIDLRKK